MRKEIENWWKQAKKDLITAENCKESGDYYACAFFVSNLLKKPSKIEDFRASKIYDF